MHEARLNKTAPTPSVGNLYLYFRYTFQVIAKQTHYIILAVKKKNLKFIN